LTDLAFKVNLYGRAEDVDINTLLAAVIWCAKTFNDKDWKFDGRWTFSFGTNEDLVRFKLAWM
jgi:hypothetical protein